MPMKPWSIENPDQATAEGRNWRIFGENSKTIIRNDLAFVSATSDPVINFGYFTLYGPLVFYNIKCTLDSNDGWTTSSYIILPFQEFSLAGTRQVTHQGVAYVGSTGASITQLVFGSTTNYDRLAFAGAYTNASGADQEVFLQGWYIRG